MLGETDCSDPDRARLRAARRRPLLALVPAVVASLTAAFIVGCSDDLGDARSIQAGRQASRQGENKIDHLGEAFGLVSNLIELHPESAHRRIIYHLNAWQESAGHGGRSAGPADTPEIRRELLLSVAHVIPPEEFTAASASESFTAADVEYLKLRYLLRRLTEWVRADGPSDPLWNDWIESRREDLGGDAADQLAIAARLFDWTVRNIALEPADLPPAGSAPVRLPPGMRVNGPGYRQTPYQTLFRGTGDALQRAAVFIGLCRQAELPACVLATSPESGGDTEAEQTAAPWAVGVLIGGDMYLFDCALGVPIVGPEQTGIATLTQARRDPSVLRRMNVPGWFDYPIQRGDVQQCRALLLIEPEAVTGRAERLQRSLTGDLRMRVYEDADALAESFENVPGIAAARIWDVPLAARIYQSVTAKAKEQDPLLAIQLDGPWTILEADVDQSRRLASGRWRHLLGEFDSDELEGIDGAKKLYLSQRQPEFEIAELRDDVELQMRYGIRRELGVSSEVYDRQIRQVQDIMRHGKITASYWLSLIQYETGRMDLAKTWFSDRILGDGIDSRWDIAARYNLARALEHLGEFEQAAELYRTEGDPQEHGNRIRTRLIQRAAANNQSEPEA